MPFISSVRGSYGSQGRFGRTVSLLGLSESSPATSANQIKTQNPSATSGLYWIQPSGAPAAEQMYCIMDSSVGGGGWTLALNIIASDTTGVPGNGIATYDNTLWTAQGSPYGTRANGLTTPQKTYAYGYLGHNQVLIILHNKSNTSWRGWGRYAYTASFQGQTLFQLAGSGSQNKVVTTGGRAETGGSGTPFTYLNSLRNNTRGGDLFIDTNISAGVGAGNTNPSSNNANDNLVYNAGGAGGSWWGNAQPSQTRITTTAGQGNNSYPYTFAGIGGKHANESNWGCDYAMTPVYAYCDGPYGYGIDSTNVERNYLYPGTIAGYDYGSGQDPLGPRSTVGGSNGCRTLGGTGTPAYSEIDVGYAIFVR